MDDEKTTPEPDDAPVIDEPIAVETLLGAEDARDRARAAVVLGRFGDDLARDALLKALEREHETRVVRRIVQSLGKVGGERELDALERVDGEDEVIRRAAWLARTLVAYRIGSDRHLLDPADGTVGLEEGAGRPRSLSFEQHATIDGATARASLAQVLPVDDLEPRTAASFFCGNLPGFVVATRALAEGKTRPSERPAILGAVLREDGCNGGFTTDAYVLADPRGTLLLLRPDVGVVATGRFDEGEVLRFEIDRTLPPYLRPARVVGRFADATLQIDEAVVTRLEESRSLRPIEAPPFGEVAAR